MAADNRVMDRPEVAQHDAETAYLDLLAKEIDASRLGRFDLAVVQEWRALVEATEIDIENDVINEEVHF